MFCPNCGASVPEDSKFCYVCGKKIEVKNDSLKENPKKTKQPKKRKTGLVILAILVAAALAAAALFFFYPCIRGHVWAEATCVEPEKCEQCGATNGEPLGHDWTDATCTKLSTCRECGETRGDFADHKWEKATCAAPKTCSVCKKTEGSALGHTWKEATDTTPKRCTGCGLMEPLPRPTTGQIFEGKDKTRSSTLLVENESDLDCYVVLKNTSFEVVYSFYIRANESKHVSVPSGEFYLYLSQGEDWYGTEYYFGEGTEPRLDSSLMDFNKYWWTYTVV